MKEKNKEHYLINKLEFVKNPVIAEFLGYSLDSAFTETDEDIAKYSILKGNEHLFASKYKIYLPTEEELKAEIESQKVIFEAQQKEKK